VITGLVRTGVCVPDCEAAAAFYRDVLGLRALSPPYVMTGNAIRDDTGELVSDPSMKAAIVGFDDGDRVPEVIEYLGAEGCPTRSGRPARRDLTDRGLSHVGLVCEDIDATRAELESKGVVFILAQKSRLERTHFSQWD
jgi:catechol 2,3-dioxygenase-like lactoylglutathione lyase family enzyme